MPFKRLQAPKSPWLGLGLLVALLLVAAGMGRDLWRGSSPIRTPAGAAQPAGAPSDPAILAEAFRAQRSNLWVSGAGVVTKILPDDTEGTPHQRWIVRLESGQTVLISHNLDLAPRVPLARGVRISFRGLYVWNRHGGVVHWTHRDPAQQQLGGWIERDGRRYR